MSVRVGDRKVGPKDLSMLLPWPHGYKMFFMLNSIFTHYSRKLPSAHLLMYTL